MNELEALAGVDFFRWGMTGILIIIAIVGVMKVIQEFLALIGKPIGWKKMNDEDHKAIIAAKGEIQELRERQESNREESRESDMEIKQELSDLKTELTDLKEGLSSLKEMVIDKDIADMRLTILDFASAITSGRKFSREQYSEVINTHDRYQEAIERHGRKNGKVDLSMEVINRSYINRYGKVDEDS